MGQPLLGLSLLASLLLVVGVFSIFFIIKFDVAEAYRFLFLTNILLFIINYYME